MARKLKDFENKRDKLLDAHNKLRNILVYAGECYTIDLKHLGQIDEIVHMLHDEFDFEPPIGEDGNRQYWADWVKKGNDNG